MENCKYHKCQFPATIKITFTSGMIGKYCNTHGAIFDQEIIEETEPIENDLFLTILAKWEAKFQEKGLNMSECHSSARCDTEQLVQLIDGVVIRTTVHNVHLVKSFPAPYYRGFHYRGFRKNEAGYRPTVTRSENESLWIEEKY